MVRKVKKVVKVLFVLILGVLISGCTKSDAIKFKEEYESLNGKTTSSGKEYRKLEISEDNPFVYLSTKELLEKIDNQETFLVYFGYASCPWCRSVIGPLISASKDNDVSKIYYIDLYEIRDILKIEDGEIVTEREGTKDYKEILNKLDNLLEEYTLMDGDEEVKTGEKRIYAPSVVSIVKGKGTKLTLGISELQTDPYMELSGEMIEDSYNSFVEIIDEINNSDLCEIGSKC